MAVGLVLYHLPMYLLLPQDCTWLQIIVAIIIIRPVEIPAVNNYLLKLHKLWTKVHEQLIKQMEPNKQQATKARRLSDIKPRDKILLSIKYLKLTKKAREALTPIYRTV